MGHAKDTRSAGLFGNAIEFGEAQKRAKNVAEHESNQQANQDNDEHHQKAREEFGDHADKFAVDLFQAL